MTDEDKKTGGEISNKKRVLRYYKKPIIHTFLDVGTEECDAKIKRLLIVKEAIEIAKVKGTDLLKEKPFLGTDKLTGEKEQRNIIKLYADWIEEALKINEKTPPPIEK